MPARTWFVLFAVLGFATLVAAQPVYQPGTLVNIEKHADYIPQEWHWDTVVVFKTLVKYQLKVRLANQTYLAEYLPDIQPNGPIPGEWKDDAPLEARLENRSLFIRLSYGPEIETHIVKRLKQ